MELGVHLPLIDFSNKGVSLTFFKVVCQAGIEPRILLPLCERPFDLQPAVVRRSRRIVQRH